jgi:hypothetical protein
MGEILSRVWDNLIGRGSGPMNFRLIIQPLVACIIAIRAGLKDAREGRPAFFWAALSHRQLRAELMHQGWKDVGKVFIIAAILDSIYQLKVHRGVFLGELIVTATVLAIVPYLLLRGPVSRIARRRPVEKQVTRKAS